MRLGWVGGGAAGWSWLRSVGCWLPRDEWVAERGGRWRDGAADRDAGCVASCSRELTADVGPMKLGSGGGAKQAGPAAPPLRWSLCKRSAPASCGCAVGGMGGLLVSQESQTTLVGLEGESLLGWRLAILGRAAATSARLACSAPGTACDWISQMRRRCITICIQEGAIMAAAELAMLRT